MKSNLLFFGLGAVIGSVATYFVVRDSFRKYADDEISEMYEYYNDKIESIYMRLDENKAEEIEKDLGLNNEEKVNYNKIIFDLNKGNYSTEVEDKTHNVEVNNIPYIISDDDWIERNGNEKVILSYFEEDEVLIFEESDEVMDNGVQIIGADNLQQFSRYSEEGTLYIRNDMMGTDYMVVLETGSYANYIAGEFEE